MEDKSYQCTYCDKPFSNGVFFIWATSTALMGKYISALHIELFMWKSINASNLKKYYRALLARKKLCEDKQPELIMHNPISFSNISTIHDQFFFFASKVSDLIFRIVIFHDVTPGPWTLYTRFSRISWVRRMRRERRSKFLQDG